MIKNGCTVPNKDYFLHVFNIMNYTYDFYIHDNDLDSWQFVKRPYKNGTEHCRKGLLQIVLYEKFWFDIYLMQWQFQEWQILLGLYLLVIDFRYLAIFIWLKSSDGLDSLG